MTGISDELLKSIAESAEDPTRRYLGASREESRIELPVAEIEKREEEWTRRLIVRSSVMDGVSLSPDEVESYIAEWRVSRDAMRDAMNAQMRASGQTPPETKYLFETEEQFSVSSDPPGARPLQPPPSEKDWKALEQFAGRPVPKDLRRLYSIADGGFGPGFSGLNSVQLIKAGSEDFRRRGPDYCETVNYPDSYLHLASENLDYHYDLETNRILSSNSRWQEDDVQPSEIYKLAFISLAQMMEDWLSRS